MATKVLLVDDDVTFTRMLECALQDAGYQVLIAHNGLAGLQRLYEDPPDLVILDVMMPFVDGWEICKTIREDSNVPILMLTVLSGDSHKIRAFENGADAHLAKPFDLPVLLAQIDALLRRAHRPSAANESTVRAGDLWINLAKREATLSGRRLNLTPIEFRLLAALASRPGQVVSKRELLTRVWGAGYAEETMYLKLYIFYLRRKIERDSGHPRYILTRRGVGYFLNCEQAVDMPSGMSTGSVSAG